MKTSSQTSPEPQPAGPTKKRRHLSAEKKFQVYLETQHPSEPVGAILRREGLFSTDLARIRQQVKEGALPILAISYRRVVRWQAHARQGAGLADARPGPREALHRLRPGEIESITTMAQSQE